MSGENDVPKPENEVVRIPPNRLQKLNQLLTRLFVVASAYFLLALSTAGQPLLALLAIFLLTASATLSVFSFMELIYSWMTTALRADANGITDATGPVPGGLVRWDEILGITESTVNDEPILLFHLYNTQAYLDRLPEMKRAMLAGSVSVYGTPCVVSQSDIGIPVAEAQLRLEEARQRFVRVPVLPVTSTVSTAPTAHWWTAVPPEERKAQPLRSGLGDGSGGDR
ncbi:MAG: hypothetical protein H8F28_26790 [Fibrella sp.]|nr:hypothetical protein [Armatimonadota bacterium]